MSWPRRKLKVANKIYDAVVIYVLARWRLSKNPGILEYKQHRTIRLVSQITKIIIRIIMDRNRSKIRQQVSGDQFGFMEGKENRNAIFVLRKIAERALKMQKDLSLFHSL